MVYRKTEAVIQRAENKRARILTAALQHMADVGWPRFDGHAVAANLQMATTGIYVYFPTMPELINEAIGLLAHADATGMRSSDPDALTRYTRAVKALINRSTPQRAGTECSSHPVYKTAIKRELERAIADVHWEGGRRPHISHILLATAVYGALFAILDDDPTPGEITRHKIASVALCMIGAPTKELVA